MRSGVPLFALLFFACCGAEVRIHNNATIALMDVKLAALASQATIEAVPPSSVVTTKLCPRGEAGEFEISFKAGSQTYRTRQPAYFECNPAYVVDVQVSPTYTVTSHVTVR